MKVSVQLHAPAVLPKGKMSPLPIEKEAGYAPVTVWRVRRRENLPLSGNRTRNTRVLGVITIPNLGKEKTDGPMQVVECR